MLIDRCFRFVFKLSKVVVGKVATLNRARCVRRVSFTRLQIAISPRMWNCLFRALIDDRHFAMCLCLRLFEWYDVLLIDLREWK